MKFCKLLILIDYQREFNAGGGTRTHMELYVPLDFESSASANFATPASWVSIAQPSLFSLVQLLFWFFSRKLKNIRRCLFFS